MKRNFAPKQIEKHKIPAAFLFLTVESKLIFTDRADIIVVNRLGISRKEALLARSWRDRFRIESANYLALFQAKQRSGEEIIIERKSQVVITRGRDFLFNLIKQNSRSKNKNFQDNSPWERRNPYRSNWCNIILRRDFKSTVLLFEQGDGWNVVRKSFAECVSGYWLFVFC